MDGWKVMRLLAIHYSVDLGRDHASQAAAISRRSTATSSSEVVRTSGAGVEFELFVLLLLLSLFCHNPPRIRCRKDVPLPLTALEDSLRLLLSCSPDVVVFVVVVVFVFVVGSGGRSGRPSRTLHNGQEFFRWTHPFKQST